MNTSSDAVDLQRQLYCYAEDLQTLFEQHCTLVQQHRAAMQALGHANLHYDLLLGSLLGGKIPYLVTDTQGNMTEVSAAALALLGESGAYWHGLSIEQLTPFAQRAGLAALLAELGSPQRGEAMVLHQLDLFDGREFDSVTRFDVLLVPLKTYAQLEFFWLLHPHVPSVHHDLVALQQFDWFSDRRFGIFVTNAQGLLVAGNQTLADITGYAMTELVGSNPKLFSSGHHDPEFYKAFWRQLTSTGSWSGQFLNRRKGGQIYQEWETIKAIRSSSGETLAYLALVVGCTDDGHQMDSELAHMAYHDALTGLPNRRMLDQRLNMLLKQVPTDGLGFGLLFVDLDRFKPINDELGHEVGDLVLREVAKRLKQLVRQGDMVARVGGDEFVIVLQSGCPREVIDVIAGTLILRLGALIVADEHHLSIGASAGCALYPQDGTDRETLLKHADAAMYAAKRQGGGRLCFFDAAHDAGGAAAVS